MNDTERSAPNKGCLVSGIISLIFSRRLCHTTYQKEKVRRRKRGVRMPETRHVPRICKVADRERLRQGGCKALGVLYDVVVEEARIRVE